MRYFFAVGHPAHVHLFKNVIRKLWDRGHEVLAGAVSRESTVRLLAAYEIPYFEFGVLRTDLLSKILDILPKDLSLIRRVKRFDPTLLVSTGSPYAAHASAVLGRPHLVFGDTEHATLVAQLTLPFSDAVCTPRAFEGDLGPKHVRYNGYKELAYLDPKYFTPDPTVLKRLRLATGTPFVVVRFSAWDASHDIGGSGFQFTNVSEALEFVQRLEAIGRVFVTSDRSPIRGLESYDLKIPPERMHDLLSFASLYVGEGATMAAEAGVLGVPWIFVSNRGRGFLTEQQDVYGLGYWTKNSQEALERLQHVTGPDVSALWRGKRDRMLREKQDVVKFIVDFIEGWGERDGGGQHTSPPGVIR